MHLDDLVAQGWSYNIEYLDITGDGNADHIRITLISPDGLDSFSETEIDFDILVKNLFARSDFMKKYRFLNNLQVDNNFNQNNKLANQQHLNESRIEISAEQEKTEVSSPSQSRTDSNS